jgi:hypothetical protein
MEGKKIDLARWFVDCVLRLGPAGPRFGGQLPGQACDVVRFNDFKLPAIDLGKCVLSRAAEGTKLFHRNVCVLILHEGINVTLATVAKSNF